MIEFYRVQLPIDGGMVIGPLQFLAERGKITCVAGPGKSSVLRAIMGFVEPVEGVISIGGERVTPHSAPFLRRMMTYEPKELKTIGQIIPYYPPTKEEVAALKASRNMKLIALFDEPNVPLERLQSMADSDMAVVVATDDEMLLSQAWQVVRVGY